MPLVPNGCSTVHLRVRMRLGLSSIRKYIASIRCSCSQRVIRRSLPVVHRCAWTDHRCRYRALWWMDREEAIGELMNGERNFSSSYAPHNTLGNLAGLSDQPGALFNGVPAGPYQYRKTCSADRPCCRDDPCWERTSDLSLAGFHCVRHWYFLLRIGVLPVSPDRSARLI
jgi:hypothetical protein